MNAVFLTGAPGYITSSLLNGMSFVDGWEQNFFVSKWSMHQMVLIIFNVMAGFQFFFNLLHVAMWGIFYFICHKISLIYITIEIFSQYAYNVPFVVPIIMN